MAAVLLLCSSCTGPTADFDISYEVVDDTYNQYFVLDPDQLLIDLNASLSEYNLSLSVSPKSDEDLSTWYTENSDGWKIIAHTMGTFSAKISSETKSWSRYIQKVELSLYSEDDETAKRNGQYIRALISTFTPGAEETVENALGIYGTPSSRATISDGIYRATMGNVCYEYQPNRDKFFVRPLDQKLHQEVTIPKSSQNVIRPD